jgi:hypothetical protein
MRTRVLMPISPEKVVWPAHEEYVESDLDKALRELPMAFPVDECSEEGTKSHDLALPYIYI